MKLEGCLGDIHPCIDDCVFGLHSVINVLTHPYLYELTGLAAALATVRVWSIGHARLWLGYGLARGRPRVARARARRRSPFAQGCRPHVLACARKARDRKERSNQMRAKPQQASSSAETRLACRFSLRCSTPARYARLRGTAQREALPRDRGVEERPEHVRVPEYHIQMTYKGCAPRATLGTTPQSPTPTGLPPKAQGCAPRATLGIHTQTPINPERVASQCFRCDGTGGVCNICGESERACGCGDETAIVECSDCKGTGL